MKPLKPSETLERYIRQNNITTGPAKLAMFKLALTLRGTPGIYSQEHVADPIVHVRVFDPCGSWSWLIIGWDGRLEAFGMVIGHEQELGYISLGELSEVPGPLGIGLEVDVWFYPQALSQAIKNL